jgi:1,4-alpha-glucan branching enzyme
MPAAALESRTHVKRSYWLSLFFLLTCVSLQAIEIAFQPQAPTFNDAIQIEVRGCTQGGVLHWGVNAKGNQWVKAIRAYWPAGSVEEGVATQTRLAGPDAQGVCRVTLGPFDDDAQPVGSIDFAIRWADGSWESAEGSDYHIPVSLARIRVEPQSPSLNDVIKVIVRRSRSGGQLRWGVNAVYGMWSRPHSNCWPRWTVPSDDGLAVDSPLSAPDEHGDSVVFIGPFNRPEQVVNSLHMAVHWGDEWDTDLGRNYNVRIARNSGSNSPVVFFSSPRMGDVFAEDFMITAKVSRAASVSLWLDGKPLAYLNERPFEWPVKVEELGYGRHELMARTFRGGQAAVAQIGFWRVPPVQEYEFPEDAPLGATVQEDGAVLFALHAPGKRFVSVVGDFNRWDAAADLMNASPGGTWWLKRVIERGVHQYQYCVDGEKFLADPYSRDVEWKDEKGEETYLPEKAKSIVAVGQKPFEWSDAGFRRPSLENLLIYEFFLPDVCPGQGFTGVIARLDYIKGLGVTAIEPLPVNEFTGATSWGYNPSFHLAPETTYGTPEELKRLVDEAHKRGLAVIMDVVLNHMDYNSPLYQLYGLDYDASPYFHRFLGENWGFPDLRQDSAAFKRYVADMLRCWTEEYHVDGFRYDATRWVGWKGYNDWGASWFAYAAKQADSNSYQIAEHLPSDPDLQNKTEMDAGWHDQFRWQLRDMIRNAKLDRGEFERIMDARKLGFSNSFQRVVYIESHDEERYPRDLDESGYSTEDAVQRDVTALAIMLTAPGVAMVYAGEEFGESTPKVVGPNPLRWTNLEKPVFRGLYDDFRALANLRTTHPALRTESISFQTNSLPDNVLVYERSAPDGSVVVAANFDREEQSIPVVLSSQGSWVNILDPDQPATAGPTNLLVTLPPGGSIVLSSGK